MTFYPQRAVYLAIAVITRNNHLSTIVNKSYKITNFEHFLCHD